MAVHIDPSSPFPRNHEEHGQQGALAGHAVCLLSTRDDLTRVAGSDVTQLPAFLCTISNFFKKAIYLLFGIEFTEVRLTLGEENFSLI